MLHVINEAAYKVDHELVRGAGKRTSWRRLQQREMGTELFTMERCHFKKASFSEIQGACNSMTLKVPKEILEKSFEWGKT